METDETIKTLEANSQSKGSSASAKTLIFRVMPADTSREKDSAYGPDARAKARI
jgi:hypothetical protein